MRIARCGKAVGVAVLLAVVSFPLVLFFMGCGGTKSGSSIISSPAIDEPPTGDRIGITIGDDFEQLSDSDLEASMDDIESLHVGWLRFEMSWTHAQPDDQNHFKWESFDRIVEAAARHNIQVLPILAYTPKWARLPACLDSFTCAPVDPSLFARFAGAAAAHFKTRGVHHWEIWNEPNIDFFWMPKPDAAAYTELLRQSFISIKQVDSQATVISGGLAPVDTPETTVDPREFLKAMYDDGAKNYMDAVGYHPYSAPVMPGDVKKTNGWSAMSDLNPSIRSIMADNGDRNKQIWATEFGVPTGGPLDYASEDLQEYEFAEAMDQMAGKPWLATLFFHSYKDLGVDRSTINDFFGIVRYDGSRKPAYFVIKQKLSMPGQIISDH